MNPKKPIPLILLSLLFFSSFMESSLAQAQTSEPLKPPIPQYFQDCQDKLPRYPEAKDINLEQPYPNQESLNFRIAFEKTRTQYHAFVECVFEKAVADLLTSPGGDTQGIFSAHAPNLPEWSKPTSACLAETDLVKRLTNGSPETLVDPLLQTYNAYVDGLQTLFQAFSSRLGLSGPSGTFERAVAQSQSLRHLVENETQDALVALDSAFVALKEMRQAFVMHVHFQCMLKNLEFYRRAMENFRRVVSGLPPTIVDASMHKQ